MTKGWKVTNKGRKVMEEAHKLYPEAVELVCGDSFLYSIHIASGGTKKPKLVGEPKGGHGMFCHCKKCEDTIQKLY